MTMQSKRTKGYSLLDTETSTTVVLFRDNELFFFTFLTPPASSASSSENITYMSKRCGLLSRTTQVLNWKSDKTTSLFAALVYSSTLEALAILCYELSFYIRLHYKAHVDLTCTLHQAALCVHLGCIKNHYYMVCNGCYDLRKCYDKNSKW